MAEVNGLELDFNDQPTSTDDVSEAAGQEWPDPAPLGEELPPVPVFPLELLPNSLRPLVQDTSERMQAPPDYAAAASIVALAGCVNRRASVNPKREDASWLVIPNLWGCIVGPPGVMKSPTMWAAARPLARIEEGWRVEFESETAGFELEKEQAELRYQAWREEYKRAVKKNEAPPIQPDRTMKKPTQRRLVLQDATFEKLHEILAENPSGVLVIRDELTGWLADLDRQGRESERAFFLQAWNGDAAFTVDRIGRGSIYVPAVCVSLMGNIQPARLRAYLSEAMSGGPQDDGLFQRFQIAVWPDLPADWKLVDRSVNQTAFDIADQVFHRLVKLSADEPVRMRFAADAQELFNAWWTELENKKIRNLDLAAPLISHFSKYRSLMPSLAGLFELADMAAEGQPSEGQAWISLKHAKMAAAFCDYLEIHARRIYSCITAPEVRAARELARHIQRGGLKSIFTTRDIYLKGWSALGTPEAARDALTLLEEASWVIRLMTPATAKGGRPPEEWEINPKVRRRICAE